jgi:hypothetical protein
MGALLSMQQGAARFIARFIPLPMAAVTFAAFAIIIFDGEVWHTCWTRRGQRVEGYTGKPLQECGCDGGAFINCSCLEDTSALAGSIFHVSRAWLFRALPVCGSAPRVVMSQRVDRAARCDAPGRLSAYPPRIYLPMELTIYLPPDLGTYLPRSLSTHTPGPAYVRIIYLPMFFDPCVRRSIHRID